ncbi:murein L,D-transpeptidase catalytic domain family protein [Telluribacter sp. SYSU D00476]|uniref:murein L,D-transpeptidase catalytic domain family protein n=1 Tax=Telluribacter sp. SYSU D00476 TaxID=2811430 RepID=UPI001FF1C853|nr:murein L,D-transpeptidase catalytic domain family protein [Telluribacter sp. SYSU D00476]
MKKASVVLVMAVITLAVLFGFRNVNSTPPSLTTDSIPFPQVDSMVVVPEAEARPEWSLLYESLELGKLGLSKETFHYAWVGFKKMNLRKPIIAIADFSQSSRNKRLYIIDMASGKLLYNTHVAHGRNSGIEYAKSFSNENSSYQSSLGFYRTLGTYQGKHGLSLRLEGLEKGINDRALERAIVMHGAEYVSEDIIRRTGRLGRSLGCPAISMADHQKIIGLLNGGAGLFLYYPDNKYLSSSNLLAGMDQISDQVVGRLSQPYTSSK